MFNYFEGSVGAILLHLASSSFLFDNGRVLGCSSMLYNTLANPSIFNVPTIAGMATSALGVKYLLPQYLPSYAAVVPIAGSAVLPYIISGILVGVGTQMGSGCTSGHMLCGVARGSVRSLVATCVFTGTAALTAFLLGTPPACAEGPCYTISNPSSDDVTILLSVLTVFASTRYLLRQSLTKSKVSQALVSFYSGLTFGTGLLIAGMASPGVTLGFLALWGSKFNPTLLMVMLFGVLPNAYEYWTRRPGSIPASTTPASTSEPSSSSTGAAAIEAPTCCQTYNLPTRTQVDAKLIIGAAIFGIGWGMSGICPGPGVLSAVLNGTNGLTWVAAFFAGYSAMTRLA